jgi:hypothetical protein
MTANQLLPCPDTGGNIHFFLILTPPISEVIKTWGSAWNDTSILTSIGLERDLDTGQDKDHRCDYAVDGMSREIRSGADTTDKEIADNKDGGAKYDKRASTDLVDQKYTDEGSDNPNAMSDSSIDESKIGQAKQAVESRAVHIDELTT